MGSGTISIAPFKLRNYQADAIAGLHAAFDGEDRPTGSGRVSRAAVVLPTGAGKTCIFAHPDLYNPIINPAAGPTKRMLVLVHRDELAAQAVAKLRAISSVNVGRVQAHHDETDTQIIVASVQTLARRPRRERITNVGFVVVDEAHHATAPTYVTIMKHFGCFDIANPVPTAGFTATMTRSDEGALGDVWQEIVCHRDILDGIRGKWLVDVRAKQVVIEGLDLSQVKRSRGDLVSEDLGEHLMGADAPEQVAKAYVELAADRQGLVFWPDLASATAGAVAFNDHGIRTETIIGDTSAGDRAAIYDRYQRGQTQALSSCMVLTEGFDMPQASCAVIARPTQAAGLYVQMAGRVVRPHHLPVPGYPPKIDALLLDVVGATARHRLATVADLSISVAAVEDGQSLAEAADEAEEPVGRVRPARQATGYSIHDVDLFEDRRSLWLRTPRGTSFVPAGDYLVFLWPDIEVPGLWMIGVAASRGAPGTAKPVASGLTMEWAIERAEHWANELIARAGRGAFNIRKASWRRGPARDRAVFCARSLGCVVPEGATSGYVSDLISIALATRALGG